VPFLKHIAVYIIDEMITRAKRTLTKGDITRICKRNLLSYSAGGSTCREVVPVGRIWDSHFGEGQVVGGYRRFHSKERWWFPIGSPLWPLRYR